MNVCLKKVETQFIARITHTLSSCPRKDKQLTKFTDKSFMCMILRDITNETAINWARQPFSPCFDSKENRGLLT